MLSSVWRDTAYQIGRPHVQGRKNSIKIRFGWDVTPMAATFSKLRAETIAMSTRSTIPVNSDSSAAGQAMAKTCRRMLHSFMAHPLFLSLLTFRDLFPVVQV